VVSTAAPGAGVVAGLVVGVVDGDGLDCHALPLHTAAHLLCLSTVPTFKTSVIKYLSYLFSFPTELVHRHLTI
jgi:hypothetical protein